MSTPRKQGRGISDLLSPRRKTADREILPVFPKNLFKFDPVDFWIEQFNNCVTMLDADTLHETAEVLAERAGKFADAALNVAEERWGKQRVK